MRILLIELHQKRCRKLAWETHEVFTSLKLMLKVRIRIPTKKDFAEFQAIKNLLRRVSAQDIVRGRAEMKSFQLKFLST